MEKQTETSTYEAVPQGTPNAAQPAPVASGTLRPPGPPSGPPGPVVRSTAPPAPPRSLPPPPPPAATQRRDENTQQIDIGQIEEVRNMQRQQRAASSVPPPTPKTATLPPPQRLSDKTQPLRLDQILQVAQAQKAASVPPPAQPAKELVTPARARPLGSSTVQGLGTPPSRTMMGMAAPPAPSAETSQELVSNTAPGLGGLPKQEPQLFSQLDEPLGEPASEKMFDAPPSAKPLMKATLMGLGNGQHSMDVTLEHGASDETLEHGAGDVTQVREPPRAPNGESLRPSGRPPLREPSFDQHDETASLALPSNTLASFGSRFFADRRKAMYAGAAVVGVGVLTVLASALFSKDPAPVANRAHDPQPVAVAAAAPAPAAAPVAAAPKPTVIPIVPAAPAEPAPVAEATPGTPRVQALPPPPKSVEEPAPREERKHHHHREVVASAPTKAKREEAPKERASTAKTSKTSGADKTADKSSQFDAAREEARAAYAAKNYKAAAAAFEKASKLDPKQPGTFAGLGAARLQLGDNKAAVAAYQRAVQLQPDNSGFHAALGRAYLGSGDRAKAVASYKKALSLNPNNAAARDALAQLGG